MDAGGSGIIGIATGAGTRAGMLGESLVKVRSVEEPELPFVEPEAGMDRGY